MKLKVMKVKYVYRFSAHVSICKWANLRIHVELAETSFLRFLITSERHGMTKQLLPLGSLLLPFKKIIKISKQKTNSQ